MQYIIRIIGVLSVFFLLSCNNETSLQEYFVDHHGDTDFISLDLPTSLLDTGSTTLSEENKETIKSIHKLNFLALPLKEATKTKYASEVTSINQVLSAEQYQTLMKLDHKGTKMTLKYLGEEEDIDEIIVFSSNKESGLVLVRILGDNMKPENIVRLANVLDKEDIGLDAFKNIIGRVEL